VWTGFNWLRTGTGGMFMFYERHKISRLSEPLFASQEEPCSMELGSYSLSFSAVTFISFAAMYSVIFTLVSCKLCEMKSRRH
jgi:hypothetical protein